MLNVRLKKKFLKKDRVEFSLDVSFAAGSGFTVLSGASGVGKTTVLKLIAGVLQPDEGFIKLGENVFFDSEHKIDLTPQKRNVGFVFQDYLLFPHLTAEQNIAYGVKRTCGKTKANDLLSLFNIGYLKSRFPQEMSGGEQQRVALARALASDPKIVLLDEPLSAVDVETRLKLADELENTQKRANIPFIYVTHNEDEAKRFGGNRINL